MSLPSILPPQQTILQRLFAEMPQSFSKDPVSTPALNVTISPEKIFTSTAFFSENENVQESISLPIPAQLGLNCESIINGNYLYVDNMGIRVYNISDPNNPVYIKTIYATKFTLPSIQTTWNSTLKTYVSSSNVTPTAIEYGHIAAAVDKMAFIPVSNAPSQSLLLDLESSNIYDNISSLSSSYSYSSNVAINYISSTTWYGFFGTNNTSSSDYINRMIIKNNILYYVFGTSYCVYVYPINISDPLNEIHYTPSVINIQSASGTFFMPYTKLGITDDASKLIISTSGPSSYGSANFIVLNISNVTSSTVSFTGTSTITYLSRTQIYTTAFTTVYFHTMSVSGNYVYFIINPISFTSASAVRYYNGDNAEVNNDISINIWNVSNGASPTWVNRILHYSSPRAGSSIHTYPLQSVIINNILYFALFDRSANTTRTLWPNNSFVAYSLSNPTVPTLLFDKDLEIKQNAVSRFSTYGSQYISFCVVSGVDRSLKLFVFDITKSPIVYFSTVLQTLPINVYTNSCILFDTTNQTFFVFLPSALTTTSYTLIEGAEATPYYTGTSTYLTYDWKFYTYKISAGYYYDNWNVTSNDYVTFVIADAKLSISSSVSYIDSETIDLNTFTIYELVNYFNAKYYQYGIIASLPVGLYPDDGLFKATSLIEGVYDVDTTIATIDRFTSLNYALMSTFSLLLIENQKTAKAALAQTDLRVTTEQWADFWGHLLGVDRTSSDIGNDIVYKKRILREAVYPKSNNIALADLVTSITGRDSSVVDGGNPMILGGSSATVKISDFPVPNRAASATASLATLTVSNGSGLTVAVVTNGSAASGLTINTTYATGAGSGARITAAASSITTSATISNAGTGYSVGDILLVSTGTGGKIYVTSVNASGGVVSFIVNAAGSSYVSGTTYDTTSTGYIAAISLGSSGGTGYAIGDCVTIGSAIGGTATAVVTSVSGGVVQSGGLSLAYAGSGYSSTGTGSNVATTVSGGILFASVSSGGTSAAYSVGDVITINSMDGRAIVKNVSSGNPANITSPYTGTTATLSAATLTAGQYTGSIVLTGGTPAWASSVKNGSVLLTPSTNPTQAVTVTSITPGSGATFRIGTNTTITTSGTTNSGIVASGSGYTVGDVLTIGSGLGRIKVATLGAGNGISTYTVDNAPASSYRAGTGAKFTPAFGSGAIFTAASAGSLTTSATITNAGTGYSANDILNVGLLGGRIVVSSTDSGKITGFSINSTGSNYVSGTSYSTTYYTTTVSITSGAAITASGSGYMIGDILQIGSGTGYIKVESINTTGGVVDFSVFAAGSGYTAGTEYTTSQGTGANSSVLSSSYYSTATINVSSTRTWTEGAVTILQSGIQMIPGYCGTGYSSTTYSTSLVQSKIADTTRLLLNVSNVSTGQIVSGQFLSTTDNALPANTYRVSEFLTGSGGNGTYLVSGGSTTLSSRTINFTLSTIDTLDSGQLGPNTGAGSFIVYLKKNSDESIIPQSVTSLLTTVVNRWKPAGISFVIQSY